MGYFNTFFRVEITSTIIRFSVSQKNKYRGRTVASGLSEMRSTGAYFLTVAIAGLIPACSTSFLLIKVILCYRTPVCQRPVTNHIMLKVTAQDESGNTKNYVYQTFYILFTSFLKKRFAFSESSCIIQTGFSSFESIQTKILEEIEGVVCTVNLVSEFIDIDVTIHSYIKSADRFVKRSL